jgi:acyl-CoA synthetase (AMP-forming)/AMP-acid ligase II
MLVGSAISTSAIRYADKEAFICTSTGRRLTFKQVNERCNRLAHALMNQGYKKGDVVAFLSTNRVEVAEIYFALAKTGIVGIPLNYRLAPNEVVELMRAMKATGLVCEAKFKAVAEQVQRELPTVRHVVAFGEEPSSSQWALDYETELAKSSAAEPTVEIEEHDPYYFNLTSGTTGLPKSYVLTQFHNSSIGGFMRSFDLSRQDVVMTVFPMFGRVGFGWLFGSVSYGVKNVLVNFEPAEVLRQIETERVTIVNLVATMAAMLTAEPTLKDRDLSSLRATVFAGSMLPAPIREATMKKLAPGLYEYYGMQESGSLVASTPEDRAKKPDSVGQVSLFAEVRIVDAQGKDMPVNEIGEIIGRSPNSITEYFENPEKSAETFRGGWLHTGDLGRLDEDGYLYICGRLKDMIITGGQNVHSAEVEEALHAFPGVADCAVIGLPDDLWGERVSAIVVPAAGASIDTEALKHFCRERLAGFKTPKDIFVQPEPLPRTPTGKVQKFLLVEQYGKAKKA